MSNTNNNTDWEPLVPVIPDYPGEDWPMWEDKFGKLGTPGYEKITRLFSSFGFLGHANYVTAFYTTYRNEDGLLLGVHGQYYDDSGIRHPLLMIVNPDHRGKGIATLMALHLEQEFIAQEGPKYGFTPEEFAAMPRAERAALVVPEMYKDTMTNSAGAGLLNNLVDQFYNK
jgi:hypothetical protein